ncbi:NAD-dependent protein deacetylase [Nocardioides sp. URHA0020]|uniref:NAD-dependent protein deacetylase n=1 Tax=Nocardioides sp. URHA0020 TaxID=1380392 RepID=UPI00048BF20F|nr:NAD-dependent protein deacetylase [Nocardioides sp. URHA0020]
MTLSSLEAVDALALLRGRPLVVLTGAGVSTDSGIPDYRGPGAVTRLPMTYQEFVSGPAARQRYWARSHLGWGRMRRAEPNAGHQALARLGPELLITQNVDGLHEQVGTPRLVALHGRIADVVCLDCRTTSPRAALHRRLAELNPGFAEQHAAVASRPDGDVDLQETADFVVPACPECDGVLKPDVVFFGENVPAPRVARCYEAVDALVDVDGALLVAGSSLTVMSGLRFVRRAAKSGTPVVIVNRGETRGDPLAAYRIDAGCSEFLTTLAG